MGFVSAAVWSELPRTHCCVVINESDVLRRTDNDADDNADLISEGVEVEHTFSDTNHD